MAACTLTPFANSVYSLSGQGNFSCSDINMFDVTVGLAPSPVAGATAADWFIDAQNPPTVNGNPADVDVVVVTDSSGKRCAYNYGPGVAGDSGLVPPSNKPVSSVFACADTTVKTPPNVPPTITISADTGMIDEGGSVTFSAVANEPGIIQWWSSIAGKIGEGVALTVSTLSLGSHSISATITDEGDPPLTSTSNTLLVQVNALEIASCDQSTINGTGVQCPASGEPRLVCSADLSTTADKFHLGATGCCVCNATAQRCNPELREGEVDENGLPGCPLTKTNPDTNANDFLQVPTILMFNNDPYYCFTSGGQRVCYYY